MSKDDGVSLNLPLFPGLSGFSTAQNPFPRIDSRFIGHSFQVANLKRNLPRQLGPRSSGRMGGGGSRLHYDFLKGVNRDIRCSHSFMIDTPGGPAQGTKHLRTKTTQILRSRGAPSLHGLVFLFIPMLIPRGGAGWFWGENKMGT